MRPRFLLLLLSAAAAGAAAAFVLVGAAPAPPAQAAAAATTAGATLLGGGGGGSGVKAAGKVKPLLASATGKPTAASLALQRLQHLAASALRDRGYTDVAEVTVGDDQTLGRWGRLAPLASSMAGGEDEERSSMVTLDLPKAPLAELANVADLYHSIFGITPDFSNVNDTTSFYQRVQEIILSSTPAISFDCQPSFRVWPKEINFGFPDQHSAVHFFVLPSFGPSDLVMIEGTFPDARYFSFQTYDAYLRPVSYLRDAQIRPLGNASNPFASVPLPSNEAGKPRQRQGGRAQYRLFLTKDGRRGFPNELATADRSFALPGQVVVLLRLYGIDPCADVLSRPDLEPWGYVPPVRVSARVLGTVSPTATDLVWETFPECPANNTLVVRDALTAVTNLVNMVDTSDRSCQMENVADNFVLYRPPAQKPPLTIASRTPFANSRDAAFLLACANHRHSYRRGSDLIAVVRAHLPLTPAGLADAPYVGDPSLYDVRYASFSVADLNPPGPVLRTVADDEFRAFYEERYGALQWEAVFERNVSLVVARNREVLERCGMDASESFVVELEDQTPMSDWFGIVYREVLPQGILLHNIDSDKGGRREGAAATTTTTAAGSSTPRSPSAWQQQQQQQQRRVPLTRLPYTESIYDAQRVVCAAEEDGDCDPNPYRVATVMKGHFPRVHYYLCSQLGVLTPAPQGRDPFAGKGYPLLKDDADGSGPWPSVPTYLEFCNATGPNEGLVRVYALKEWVHIHYRDPRAAPGTPVQVKTIAPGTVGVLAFPVDAAAETVVVGLSVKGRNATQAPYLAEVELCGSVFPADPHWRCYNEPPLDSEAWLLPTFDDRGLWRPATWAPRRAVELAAAEHARQHFGREARFVLPAPGLDAEAEAAWRAWAETKEEANEAWRAWRAAKEGRQGNESQTAAAASEAMARDGGEGRNGTGTTAAATATVTSMRGGGTGGGGSSGGGGGVKEDAAAGTNGTDVRQNNTSLDWKDHAPNTTNRLQRLEWRKPRPAAFHGYYCRLAFPNPARAYAVELQGSPDAPAKAGAPSAW